MLITFPKSLKLIRLPVCFGTTAGFNHQNNQGVILFHDYLTIMGGAQPFCITLGQELIIAIFNDELAALQDYAMDAGDALWYIMGTDAWLELQTKETGSALVARGYDKTYFSCFVSDEIAGKIKLLEESGIIILSSNTALTPEDLLKDLNDDASLDDIGDWIEEQSEKKGMNIEGLIFCYYSGAARKKLHGNDYSG